MTKVFISCPKCYGTGGEKRNCIQCNGWGRVNADDAVCIHVFDVFMSKTNCMNLWVCRKCKCERWVDSSG